MRKKVLFFAVDMRRGGSEKVCTDLINRLNPEKYEIELVQIFGGEYYESRLNKNIIVTSVFSGFVRGLTRLLTHLPAGILHRMLIKNKRYDVEIALGDGLPAKVVSGSKSPASRKIAWVHMDVIKCGWDLPDFRTSKGAEKIYGKFDEIVCVSEDCRRSFMQKFGLCSHMRTVYNIVPLKEIKEKAGIEETAMKKAGLNFVTVGRLEEQKGYPRLLRVAKRLLDEGFRFTLSLIGDGSQREQLKQFIIKNKMEKSVFLLGYRENPYPYMARADAFVSSSLNEAFSTVMVESVVLGVPVLTTRCCGTAELLGQGNEYGIVVENNEEALYQGWKDLLEHPEKIVFYKQRALARALEFQPEESLREWEEVLEGKGS